MMKALKSQTFHQIIVRMPNWIGDLVMATPVLQALRLRYPKAKITAYCRESLTPLLRANPYINRLLPFHRPRSSLTPSLHSIKSLRQGNYDLGVLLTNSFSSAWSFYLGHIRCRLGFQQPPRSWLLTHSLPFPPKRTRQPLVRTYQQLLEPLHISPSDSLHPQIFMQDQDRDKARQLAEHLGWSKKHLLIGINPKAAYGTTKCWLPDRFRRLTKQLLAHESDLQILFFGQAHEREAIGQICRGLSPRVLNLAGQTDLLELIGLIDLCDLLVTNDSGPMHIADALNTPLIALFGSTDPHVTPPYRQREWVLREQVPCSPCFKRRCSRGLICMRNLELSTVLGKVTERLRILKTA